MSFRGGGRGRGFATGANRGGFGSRGGKQNEADAMPEMGFAKLTKFFLLQDAEVSSSLSAHQRKC